MNRNISVFVLAALAAVSCGGSKTAPQAQQQAPALLPKVEAISVSRETVPMEGVYSTTVQANIVNNIAPQSGGRIMKVNVEIGDFVSAGQVLAEMDKAQLEQAELRLKNSKDELDRVRTLLGEGAISQSDFDQLELSYKVAKSSCDNLRDNTILCSPVDGVVTARNYDRGDMYNMSQPLFTVQQITPVKLLVAISESDYTKVKKGDRVSVTADALPGKTFCGSIVRVHPTMDAATHTFNVEVRVANERRELRPGMYARATVNFGSNSSITVPDNAVLKMQGAGTRSVFVLDEEDVATSRVVTPGRHFDGKYEILSGLEEGDRVVVKGQSTLRTGDKVEVVK